jgi:hypothetical protein
MATIIGSRPVVFYRSAAWLLAFPLLLGSLFFPSRAAFAEDSRFGTILPSRVAHTISNASCSIIPWTGTEVLFVKDFDGCVTFVVMRQEAESLLRTLASKKVKASHITEIAGQGFL